MNQPTLKALRLICERFAKCVKGTASVGLFFPSVAGRRKGLLAVALNIDGMRFGCYADDCFVTTWLFTCYLDASHCMNCQSGFLILLRNMIIEAKYYSYNL